MLTATARRTGPPLDLLATLDRGAPNATGLVVLGHVTDGPERLANADRVTIEAAS